MNIVVITPTNKLILGLKVTITYFEVNVVIRRGIFFMTLKKFICGRNYFY